MLYTPSLHSTKQCHLCNNEQMVVMLCRTLSTPLISFKHSLATPIWSPAGLLFSPGVLSGVVAAKAFNTLKMPIDKHSMAAITVADSSPIARLPHPFESSSSRLERYVKVKKQLWRFPLRIKPTISEKLLQTTQEDTILPEPVSETPMFVQWREARLKERGPHGEGLLEY